MVSGESRSVGRSRRFVTFLLLLAVAGAGLLWILPSMRGILVTPFELIATGRLIEFQKYLQSLGSWACLASVLLLSVGALGFPIPVVIVMVTDGLVYGTWRGMAVSLVGSLLGAGMAYAVGAHVGPRRARAGVGTTHASRRATKSLAWCIVLSRWLPGIPGDPMSYVAGFQRMSFRWFLLLTGLALVPTTFATAVVGTTVTQDVPTPYWILGLALLAAAYGTWRVVSKSRTPKYAPALGID